MSEKFDEVRKTAVTIALEEVGENVREDTGGNRGTHIDKYLIRAGSPLDAGHNWCGMFINWCYTEAANRHGLVFPISAGTMWSGYKIRNWAMANPDRVVEYFPLMPGDIYVMNHVSNNGHVGMVVESITADDVIEGDVMITVDGNQSTHKAGGVSLKKRTRNFSDMAFLVRI